MLTFDSPYGQVAKGEASPAAFVQAQAMLSRTK